MNNDQNPNEYGMRARDDETGEEWTARVRKFAEADPRTFEEVLKSRPKMNIWERFACCCGCSLLLPLLLVPIGLFL